MKKITIIIVLFSTFLLCSVNVYAQNDVRDYAFTGYSEFIEDGLNKLGINDAIVILRIIPDSHIENDEYGNRILAKHLRVKGNNKLHYIYVTENVTKKVIAHELIHVWQTYNGKPCSPNKPSCETEADKKKWFIL